MKQVKYVLVTGSSGLVGSEAVKFYCNKGYGVIGVDNDMRKIFFGDDASTEWNKKLLEETYPDSFRHYSVDIRDRDTMRNIFLNYQFDLIIHTASQPSHDWASTNPEIDFSINAVATLNLLENYRKHCSVGAVFIFTSTNKVYGDMPNSLPLVEFETRYELPEDYCCYNGITEKMSIDNSIHSLFGVSKLSADMMVQEYGKYFGLNTGIFRCGCITGSAHSGAQQHGFLSYLVHCIMTGRKYTIFGYKGKQVRDNIHAYDLVNACNEFYKKSVRGREKGKEEKGKEEKGKEEKGKEEKGKEEKGKGEVYNMGGSRYSNISVLEAIAEIEYISGKRANIEYSDKERIGDHKWYISDVSKFCEHYPEWNYKYDIHQILKELVDIRRNLCQ